MNVIARNLASPAMIVASVALIVALGGVGYAAAVLPKNSVGTAQLKRKAVSGGKLKSSAVTGAKVRDGSLLAADFRSGQLPAGPRGPKGDPGVPGAKGDQGPPGPTFAATAMGSPGGKPTDPPASPDESSAAADTFGRHFDFTLPRSGNVYVRIFTPFWAVNCSAGGPRSGLYLDGAPVPKTAFALPSVPDKIAIESVAVIPAAAGPHSLEARANCPNGNLTVNSGYSSAPTWTVLLLGA